MKKLIVLLASLFVSTSSLAGLESFKVGPVLKEFGPNAAIENGLSNPVEQEFKVAFDAVKPAEKGRNKSFETVARFINMHARAGVPEASISAALVVHGKATLELLNEDSYQTRFDSPNPSAAMLRALLDAGVKVVVCGQSAVAQDVSPDDLIEGVEMSLSAITAHALLQQQGYTVNPF